jgi:hypothetical protein
MALSCRLGISGHESVIEGKPDLEQGNNRAVLSQ